MTDQFRPVRPSETHAYTGERLSTGHSLETEIEHFHRYYLARTMATGLDVLDISSGEGYGSAMLAQVARSVTGVDIDPAAVSHATASHAAENLQYRHGSATALPLDDASVDLVVSFETLEHFAEHDAFFADARRVLRPGGRLIISTPERDVYSGAGSEPNPFHVKELNRVEFADLIARHFAHHVLLGQRAIVGSVLLSDKPDGPPLVFERLDADRIGVSRGLSQPRYYIAICANAPLIDMTDSVFIETGDITGMTSAIPWLKQEIEERIAIQERERTDQAAERIAIEERARTSHAVAMAAATAQFETQFYEQTAEAQREAIQLKVERDEARGRVSSLMGLWPRAELQRLRLGLAEARSAHAHAIAERDALAVLTGTMAWRVAQAIRHFASRKPRAAGLAIRAVAALRLLRGGRLKARLALRRQRAADMATLAGHPLLDHPWYSARYLADQPGTDPVAHYVWVGAAMGHDPHPLFDTRWYAACHPALGEVNPFADYLTRGMAANEDPHPIFDAQYYCAQAPEASGQALLHYGRRAAGDLRCPARFFDVAGYQADNSDNGARSLDPVTHYLYSGAAQGRDPHALFDTVWYRDTHLGGDTATNPLAHWLREGAAAGLAPHPLFPDAIPDDTALTLPQAGDTPEVSIIIPVYGRVLDTLRCLYALARRSGDVRYEVIVADDRPSAPIAPMLAWISGLRMQVNPVNLGFLGNCNTACRLARGRHLIFLNNDTVVQEDWLRPLIRLADSDPAIGMVGCKLLNRDGTIQEAGGAMLDDGWGRPFGAGQDPAKPEFNYVREVDVVIGAAFLVPREMFRAAGGFDTRYAPAYYEEFDLAFTLRERGLKVMYQPASAVVHLDGSSYGKAQRDTQSLRNHAKFCRKWQSALGKQSPRGTHPFLTRERGNRPTLLMMEDQVPQPDRNAGSVATALYVELIASLGVRVIYFPHDGQSPAPYTARLQQAGVEVLHSPVNLSDWLMENGPHLDYVWATRPYVSGHRMDELLHHTGAPILYLTHDLHSQRERRRFELDSDPVALEEAIRVEAIERSIFAKVDRILSFSEDEARAISTMQPTASVTVLPLFFYEDDAVRTDPGGFAGRESLLFVGGFNHLPNIDAALWLVQEIMPALWRTHPNASVTIVGSQPPPELLALVEPRVIVAGYAADLEPLYAKARISVNPLRYGSGVKGKIVASLAAGLPVVTTTIGNEGIYLQDGAEVLIGDTAEAIAAHLATLLDDDARCQAVAAAGAAVAAARFSRAIALARVSEVLGLAQPA
ncbi:glycosyltransferase [Acidisphaera sp. L21]|uniref:glycosyltransferase n=1 Tax=Acidisphaera sp. L21 TaxID=1641851 RepID=UPI00131BEC52|nr:glycosyltransferase [Acidisphaera sp. L21]